MRLIAALLLATVSLIGYGACRNDNSPPSPPAALTTSLATSSPTQSTPGSVAAAQACSPVRPATSGDARETIQSGGLGRTYILHVPPQYDGAAAMPLVLNLHGFGSNAEQQHRYSRFPQLADQRGFIVVSPDATGSPQQQWNISAASISRVDDVAFIRDLLDGLAAKLCIDPSRIFAAGISNGSAFSQRLACELPDRIAAIGAVAVVTSPRANCADRPVPIIAFHGTDDACVPYNGGTVTCGPVRVPIAPVETALQNWAKHNACAAEASREPVTGHVTRITYAGCARGADVQLYRVEGGGHTWPGSVAVPRLGNTTTEIDATELIWDFFASHPHP